MTMTEETLKEYRDVAEELRGIREVGSAIVLDLALDEIEAYWEELKLTREESSRRWDEAEKAQKENERLRAAMREAIDIMPESGRKATDTLVKALKG